MRPLTKLATILALFAALSLLAIPSASAKGGGDMCISKNGRVIVQRGSATCFSTPGGNMAMAHGAGSFASASGSNSKAQAHNGGSAIVFLTERGFARADGQGASASTSNGSNQRATARGAGSSAQIVNCENDRISSSDGSAQFKAC